MFRHLQGREGDTETSSACFGIYKAEREILKRVQYDRRRGVQYDRRRGVHMTEGEEFSMTYSELEMTYGRERLLLSFSSPLGVGRSKKALPAAIDRHRREFMIR